MKIYLFFLVLGNFLENSLPSNSFDLDVVLSRENAAAKPSRSHVPVKSIAASPGKV